MLLDIINSPKDLKRLSLKDMYILAKEIREKIIDTVSKNGGHLAPNLGTVELTLALHYVFDSPKDKIVWDVGHQAYTHKLLTGRKHDFHTLRQYKGISGYPRKEESEHDVFGTGHASTSISAALGMAIARDFNNEKEKGHLIAVIGDGALTGGMAFEALNHAGHLGTDLIVILNDNAMSISPNIGALSAYTNRLAGRIEQKPIYKQVRSDIHLLLESISKQNKTLIGAVKRLREAALQVLTTGLVFEELGFTYIGPLDGHNLQLLIKNLEKVKNIKGPVLVHVLTKKGKGFNHSEKNPTKFHSPAAFDKLTGNNKKSVRKYSDIFADTLIKLAAENKRIIAITAAMAEGTKLIRFANTYPERMIDVGIAEQHAVTFAAGLANAGMIPVAAIYSTFLQRAYDQIVHDVCLQNLHVVFCLDRAGVVGDDGPTHHGVFDLSYLRHIPNMVVMAPKDENELQHMIFTAIEYNGPIGVRYPRGAITGVKLDPEPIKLPIGKGELLRYGDDILLLPIGNMVYPAMTAAEELEKKGVSTAVFNSRFAKPLDPEITKLAKKLGRVITIEDNVIQGGFGSGVLELLSEKGVNTRLKSLGYNNTFVEHGKVDILHADHGITPDGIVKAAVYLTKG